METPGLLLFSRQDKSVDTGRLLGQPFNARTLPASVGLCISLSRSLLKIPLTQRADHSKKRTRRLSFVIWASDLPAKVRSVAASRALRPQFRDTDQVEGRATEHE